MGKAFLYGSGGANPLNFKVVSGTTQPSNPAENTIWVNTDTAINSYVFSSQLDGVNASDTQTASNEWGFESNSTTLRVANSTERTAVFSCNPNTTYTITKSGGNLWYVAESAVSPAAGISINVLKSTNDASTQTTITTGANAHYLYCFISNQSVEAQVTIESETTNGVGAQVGDIWIKTGASSNAAFNALEKDGLWVYPLSAMQYVGSAWASKSAKIYKSGVWVDFTTYYYTPGDPHTDITGGWVATAGAWTEGADGISIASAANAVLMTVNTVDLTNISTLKATADLSNAEGNPYLQFGIYSSGDIYTFAAQSTFAQANANGAVVGLDVSSFTGAYKLKFYGTRNSDFKILQVEGM